MQDFRNKVAVVTGAASGIGEALARAGAARGMRLALADVDEEGLRRVAAEIGGDVLTMSVDVGKGQQVEAFRDAILSRFGAVDLLCNNAGVVPGGRHRWVWEYDEADWRWAFDVNVIGLVNGLRSFVPAMIAAGTPAHILNTASVAGFVSGAGSVAYGASKHAAVRISEGLLAGLQAVDAPIGVTTLAPGIVATRIYQSERNRPDALRTGTDTSEDAELTEAVDELYANALQPGEVAEMAFDAIEQDRFYAFTTDAYDDAITSRIDAITHRRNPVFPSLMAMTKADAQKRSKA